MWALSTVWAHSTAQAELGASHAGVAPPEIDEEIEGCHGFLGASTTWTGDAGGHVTPNQQTRLTKSAPGWRITSLLRGSTWDEGKAGPLARPGSGVRQGDTIVSINGTRLRADLPPEQVHIPVVMRLLTSMLGCPGL